MWPKPCRGILAIIIIVPILQKEALRLTESKRLASCSVTRKHFSAILGNEFSMLYMWGVLLRVCMMCV